MFPEHVLVHSLGQIASMALLVHSSQVIRHGHRYAGVIAVSAYVHHILVFCNARLGTSAAQGILKGFLEGKIVRECERGKEREKERVSTIIFNKKNKVEGISWLK